MLINDIAENVMMEDILSKIYEMPTTLLIIIDKNDVIVRVSTGWEKKFGYARAELEGSVFTDYIHPEDVLVTQNKANEVQNGKSVSSFENRYRCIDGSYRTLIWSANVDPETNFRFGIATDITEHKHLEERLQHLATHDPLTGLYNRNVLEKRLNEEADRAARYKHLLSLLMIDLDDFKLINDTYGHRAGDIVLSNFAKLLEKSFRKTDYVARYGGEEFVIILPETPQVKAEELAERLRQQVSKKPFLIEKDTQINITVSIGIATFPEQAKSSEGLLDLADLNMYEAKKAGRNQVKKLN